MADEPELMVFNVTEEVTSVGKLRVITTNTSSPSVTLVLSAMEITGVRLVVAVILDVI